MADVGVNQRAQIRMTDAEIAEFVRGSRTTTLATNGPTGTPHLVAMWYAVLDGEIWFETKAKSQKVQNLRRDDRVTCLIEDGQTYEELRGVELVGTRLAKCRAAAFPQRGRRRCHRADPAR